MYFQSKLFLVLFTLTGLLMLAGGVQSEVALEPADLGTYRKVEAPTIPTPVLQNPDFDNGAGGWTLPTGYRLVRGEGRGVTGALYYERSNPSDYPLGKQKIDLLPGVRYCVSAWIKTEDVRGNDILGATFCVDFLRDGKWLGGLYPKGLTGTTEWTRIEVSGTVPPYANTCILSLYMRKGSTGKVWYDDVTITPFSRPTVAHLLRPLQSRFLTDDGQFAIRWDLFMEPNERRAELMSRIEVRSGDKVVKTAQLPCRDLFSIGNLGTLPSGPLTLRVMLLDPVAKTILHEQEIPATCVDPAPRNTLVLSRDGSTEYVIVRPANPIPDELAAADELKTHLDQITGGNFTIVEEKAFASDKPAIYLGETAFAKTHGVDFSGFAPEEWLVKTVDGNLIITGSKMNGTLFGVYDLLENQLGCHWFAFDYTYIPRNPDLSVTSLDVRKKPSFPDRKVVSPHPLPYSKRIATQVTPETVAGFWSFGQRSRDRRHTLPPLRNGVQYYYGHSDTKQYLCGHNFHDFVSPKKYFKTHPEYFSMNEKGERFSTHPAQLCLSNPDVWKITLESLRCFIKKDRETLPPEQWPTVYDISQMDSSQFICKCPECVAITKHEGDESGLILTYINHVAREIAKEYPEIKIRTFAYTHTDNPPKTLRPEPNVIIQWADLYTRSDCYRPLTSSFNAKQKAQLEAWRAIGAKIAVWDYWNMGIQPGPFFNPPRVETMVDAISPDLRYFKEAGVISLFLQFETYPDSNPQNFADLQTWLAYQLMLDVDRDPEPLIELYLQKNYGPAAAPMSKFLHALREAIRTEKKPLFYVTNMTRLNTHNKEFLTQAYQWLSEARDLTEPGSDYRRRVEKEMITPLAVILLNPQFQIPGREAMLALYIELRTGRIERYYPPDVQVKLKERLAEDLADFEVIDIPTPPQFSQVPEDDLRKFAHPKFSSYAGGKSPKYLIVDDPDSVVGKAITAPPHDIVIVGKPAPKHDMTTPQSGMFPTRFGVYDATTKKDIAFDVPKIPADEKYHWYKIGTFDVGPGTYVHGFFWKLKADISSVYALADGIPDFNKWDVWVSVKYTGPAYVAGSTKPDQMFWDQVVLVRPAKR